MAKKTATKPAAKKPAPAKAKLPPKPKAIKLRLAQTPDVFDKQIVANKAAAVVTPPDFEAAKAVLKQAVPLDPETGKRLREFFPAYTKACIARAKPVDARTYHMIMCVLSANRISISDMLQWIRKVDHPDVQSIVDMVIGLHDDMQTIVTTILAMAREADPRFVPPSACELTEEQLAKQRGDHVQLATFQEPKVEAAVASPQPPPVDA